MTVSSGRKTSVSQGGLYLSYLSKNSENNWSKHSEYTLTSLSFVYADRLVHRVCEQAHFKRFKMVKFTVCVNEALHEEKKKYQVVKISPGCSLVQKGVKGAKGARHVNGVKAIFAPF